MSVWLLGWLGPASGRTIDPEAARPLGDQGHTSQCQPEPRPPHPAPNRYTVSILTLLTILTPAGGCGLCRPSDLPCEAVTVEAGPRVPGSQLHAATAARPEIVKVIVS